MQLNYGMLQVEKERICFKRTLSLSILKYTLNDFSFLFVFVELENQLSPHTCVRK